MLAAWGGRETPLYGLKQNLARLWNNESGISSVAYALLLAFVAVGIITGAEELRRKLTGEPIMTPILNFEVVLVSVVVFVVVMVLARIHALFERRSPKGADGEPLFTTAEPNRRNQSATPLITEGRTAS